MSWCPPDVARQHQVNATPPRKFPINNNFSTNQPSRTLGVESAEVDTLELLANVHSFLAQDAEWLGPGEDALNSCRTGRPAESPAGAAEVGAVAVDEIRACQFAARGAWRRAGETLDAATLKLKSPAAQPYRAFLQFLAAVWLDQAGELESDEALRSAARQMVRNAERAAEPARWVSEMAPLPGDDRGALGPADASAVVAIAHVLVDDLRTKRYQQQVTTVSAGLDQIQSGIYERALTDLGLLLGADASKPKPQGRCDSVWCWENHLWLALEAKSEHERTGLVAQKDIRQSNDQLRLLAVDRGAEVPVGSVTVMISPKAAVNPSIAASAEGHVHLISPEVVQVLAADALAAWKQLFAMRHSSSETVVRAAVASSLAQHGILPGQVLERLAQNPVNS